jgi:hypothetical protein
MRRTLVASCMTRVVHVASCLPSGHLGLLLLVCSIVGVCVSGLRLPYDCKACVLDVSITRLDVSITRLLRVLDICMTLALSA